MVFFLFVFFKFFIIYGKALQEKTLKTSGKMVYNLELQRRDGGF